jgi:type II secretory pathway pseudopilin PulG
MNRTRAGITFIELLVSIAIVAIIIPAVTIAASYGIRYNQRLENSRQTTDNLYSFEDCMREMIEAAYIKGTANDTSTFFMLTTSTNAVDANPDTLTFTTLNYHPSGSFIRSQDDFDQLNRAYGPQGGIKEISFSMTPVGDVDEVEGLFLREQRPADADTTQGGVESLFDGDIQSIRYECWDGIEWITTWDTSTMTTPRLPAAVQVFYKLTGDDNERSFVVRIPLSDVTTDNPITTTTDEGASITP